MTKRKCMKKHYPQSLGMVEKFVLFHGTRFRVSLILHEFYCEECNKVRDIYFLGR